MNVNILTNKRNVRVLNLKTSVHNGRKQVELRAFWKDEEEETPLNAGAWLWVPASSLDELIAALIAANNELNGGA